MNRREQKPKECEVRCVGCLVKGTLCHLGTLKGNCIECGGTKSRASHRFEGFFNEDLGTHMLELTRRSYALLDLDERVLEFSISTSNNLSRSPIRLTESDLIRCDDDLKWQFDQMIAESCLSDVRCKNPTTSLTRSALFGVRYLAALFSCDVMQEAERCSDGVRLFNIFVARVEESISKVVDGFNNVQGDERYWSEAASALAILYYGLINVQKGLENHTIRPICGGQRLSVLLAERIKWTLAHLTYLVAHPNLRCDRRWASILEGSLEDLQSKAEILSLNVRTIKQVVPISTRSLSSSSFGSASIGTPETPLSSIEATPPGDPGTFKCASSSGTRWRDTSLRPSFTPSGKMPATPYDQSQDFDFNIGLAPPETTCLEQSMSSPPCAFSYENTFDMPEPPPDITCLEQNMFSPSSAFPYEYTFDKSETPPLPPSDTSHGNGYGDFAPSEPVPNWQVLGMSLDVPSEIERTNPHVSLIRSHAYAYDFGEETSELVRDLFPGLQNQHTF